MMKEKQTQLDGLVKDIERVNILIAGAKAYGKEPEMVAKYLPFKSGQLAELNSLKETLEAEIRFLATLSSDNTVSI